MSRAALIWVSLVVLGSVVPSNAAQTADANLFQDVKAAVIAQLRDPDSARFGKLERRTRPNFEGEPVDVVCGEVNSRNGYGGYTGMSGFIYLIAQRKAYFAGGSDFWGRLGSDLYSLYCAPDLSSHTMP